MPVHDQLETTGPLRVRSG